MGGNDEVAADAPHSTRRARTRGPSERARTREGHHTVRARAFRTSPASSTRQVRAALDLVVAKCRAPRPNARFFRPRLRAGRRHHELRRASPDPRESGFAFARVIPRSPRSRRSIRGEPATAERARRSDSSLRFSRGLSTRFSSRAPFNDPPLTRPAAPRPPRLPPPPPTRAFRTRIFLSSARAGWPRARDTRPPRRAPPRIPRRAARRARPRKATRRLPPGSPPRTPPRKVSTTPRPSPRWRSARAAAAGAA